MKKALIIDGNNLLFKAYYATVYQGINLHSLQGIPTNALYAFIRMITKFLKTNSYEAVFVAFDAGKQTFRHQVLESYKAKRNATPTELIDQFSLVKVFLDLAKIPWGQLNNYEADDLIGTIVKAKNTHDYHIDIMSSDKDLYQLINDNITILSPQKGMSDLKIITLDIFKKEYELLPSQIPDLKGLMGDSSDNLPGIKGIGLKTATKLLKEYQTLENIISNADKLKPKESQLIKANFNIGLVCKQLAQIHLEAPLNRNLTQFNYDIKNLKNEELQKFYQKYDMKSLLNNELTPQIVVKNADIKIIDTWSNAWNCPNNYLWLEIFSDNYYQGTSVGFGIKNEKGTFYISFNNAKNCQIFQNFLLSEKYEKRAWDIKKVIIAARSANLKIKGFTFDHMLAAYLLYANEKIIPENIAIILNISNATDLNYDNFYGKGVKKQIPNDQNIIAQFLAANLNFLAISYDILIEKLKITNNWKLYQEIELPTAFVLIEAEWQGINVDQQALKLLTQKTLKQIEALEIKIKTIVGSDLNPNSPKQISNYLFETLKLPNYKKGSTAFEVLTTLKDAHPFINILLEYRKLQKLYSTYLIGIKKFIFKDGKIHTIYNQVQTSTGRLSSTDPNMQNISIRDEEQREVRKIFIASAVNKKIISFDYSQIELRILAHISNDENLITAFKQNHDIHSETASKVFNVPLEQVTKAQRQNAKAVNFGIVYGISDFGLAQQLKIPVKEAKKFIEKYFIVFPKIKDYINTTIKFCETNGYVQTIFNRRREVTEINNKNFAIREFGKRIAMNMPIQGSAADILKLAMIKIHDGILKQKIAAVLTAQIHDELIFEVDEDKIDIVTMKITEIMTNIIEMKVPLTIHSSVGNNWFELK